MKNVMFLVLFLSSSMVFTANAFQPYLLKSGPQLTFTTTTLDYGIIKKDADPIRKFYFKNTGDAPLLITSAKASCGCTVPSYPLEAIAPGETSEIEVRYDTKRVGMINKSISITSNTGELIVLNIIGEVRE